MIRIRFWGLLFVAISMMEWELRAYSREALA